MLPESKLQYLPLECENCGQAGYILIENMDGQYFVICKKCGGEISQMYCKECESGGDYVHKIESRPKTWTCEICGANHRIPKGFYENPIYLFSKQELPLGIQNKIEADEIRWKKQRKEGLIFGFISILIMAIVFFPPHFILHGLVHILHIDIEDARTLWSGSFFAVLILFLLISSLIDVWKHNKKMALFRVSQVIIIPVCLIPFFVMTDLVNHLGFSIDWSQKLTAGWAIICVVLLLTVPQKFRNWRLVIDPEYAEQQKKKRKG